MKVELTAQVEEMQKQLEDLKYRVLVEQGEAAKSNERTKAGNSVLQEVIQKQHVELATMQAQLSCHLQRNINLHTPAHTIIHLGNDREQRHKTLMSLRNRKIQEAKRFITARSQGLDPKSAYSQEERTTKPGDDYSIVHFDTVPIRGASARDVFEAFIDVAQNAEIVLTEMFGSLTIRENNEIDAREVSQMRLVTSTSQGTLVESNTALFAKFVEKGDDEEENYGLVVADFVESDKLYPYKPKERVKRDSTTVFMIRTLKPRSENTDDKEKLKSSDQERVVVATRWTYTKIRRSQMNLSVDALQEVQESTVSFGDTMKKCIQLRLGKTDISVPHKP
ncbi:hypothetical protein PHMEG_00011104 [Phytophthora megakarya]|uniref:Uncharacterized protein n=1 Tax=Phytophthora megakarya TaxID=4795 RepID=A0A225WE36_9STRA|nr:hypothetical protein PHMEG_00011104 [Phytophthora megakarya]